MRITDIQPIIVNVSAHTNWIFVLVKTDEGIEGVGEATLNGQEIVIAAYVKELARGLVGRDALHGIAWPDMAPQGSRGERAAVSAIEQALWDIRGKALGVPVWQLLGGAMRQTVPVYANINRGTTDRTPQGFATRASEAKRNGFRAVKCAPFDGYVWWDGDAGKPLIAWGIDRVAAVREAMGPDLSLRVDCHWRFDLLTAIRVGEQLKSFELSWLETPCSEHNPAHLAEVRRQTGLRIAGGERKTAVAEYRDLVMAEALDVLMPDVKYVGGITGLLQVAALADVFDVWVAPHNPSGPVATAATLQAVAVMGRVEAIEFPFLEVEWYAELIQREFELQDGRIRIFDGPGLGIRFNHDLAQRHPYQRVEPLMDPRLG